MPDFSSSGIWENLGGMIDYEELKLPQELINEFESWIRYYDTCFESDYSTFKKGKAKKLNTWGIELANKLKKLYPEIPVVYAGEDESMILKPIEIKI